MRTFSLVIVFGAFCAGFGAGCFDAAVDDAAVIACSGDADCVLGRVCQPDSHRCVAALDASAPPPSVADVAVAPQRVARGDVAVSAAVARAVSAFVEVDGVVAADDADVADERASATLTVDELAEGSHGVVVAAVDVFGRVGRSDAVSFVVDRTPPRLVAGSAPLLVKRGDAVVVRAALDEPVGDGVVVRFGGASVDADGEADGVIVASVNADVEGDLDVVVAGAVDEAGNAAADLVVGHVVVDGAPPVVTIAADVDTASRVAGFDTVTVAVTVDEDVSELPEATLGGRPMRCVAIDAGFSCTRVVDEFDVEGTAPVVVTAADDAGNIGFASTAVRLDFTAPTAALQQVSYRAAPGSLRPDVVAVGRGGRAEVSFLFDEAVTAASAAFDDVELSVDVEGVPVVAVDDDAAVAVGSGVFGVVVTASDAVGNVGVAHVADVAVDVDIPAVAAVDAPGAFVLLRAPWGETRAARPQLDVAVGAAADPGEEFVFVDVDDNVLGRSAVPGEVKLAAGDRDDVFVRVIDDAGNASAPVFVREGRYHVTPGGKRAGSVVPNPHRVLVRRDDRGRRAQDDDVEVGADAFAAGLDVSVDATWRQAGLGTGVTVCGDAGAAFDPVVGRIVADGCAWDSLLHRWEPLRGASLGLTNATLVYEPHEGAVFLLGGQQQIGDNANVGVFRRQGDTWAAVSADRLSVECFAGAGAFDAAHDEMVIACEGDLTLHGPISALRPRVGPAPATFRGSPPIALVADVEGVVGVDAGHTWDWDGTAWVPSAPPPGVGRLATHPTTHAPIWITAAGLHVRGVDRVWRPLAGSAPPARFRLGSIAVTDVADGVIDVSDGGAGMWQWSPSPSRWRFLRGRSSAVLPDELGSFGGAAVTLASNTSLFADDGWSSLGVAAPPVVGRVTLMEIVGRLVATDGNSDSFLLDAGAWRPLALVDGGGGKPPPGFIAGFDGLFFFSPTSPILWAPALRGTSETDPTLHIFWESFGNAPFAATESVFGTGGALLLDNSVVVINGRVTPSLTPVPPPRSVPGFAQGEGELVVFGGANLNDTWAFRQSGLSGSWRELDVAVAPPANNGVIPLSMASADGGPLLFNTDFNGGVWQLDHSVSAAVVFVADVNALDGFDIDAITVDVDVDADARVAFFDVCGSDGFKDVGAAAAPVDVDVACAIDDDGLVTVRVSAPPSTAAAASALSLASLSVDVDYRRP